MLVLSRKPGERLVINDNITLVVHRISGNRVTLGVEAPNDVRIIRGELAAAENDSDCGSAEGDQGIAAPAVLPFLGSESDSRSFGTNALVRCAR